MLGPQYLLLNCKRPLVQRLDLVVATLGAIEPRQVVEAGGHMRVLGPQHFFGNRQRPLGQRLGFRIATLGLIEQR